MSLTLARALRIGDSRCIAFAGAGGKTTAMFQLARQLEAPVIVTATTHLGAWQVRLADQHITANSLAVLEEMGRNPGWVILVTGKLDGERTSPVNDQVLDWLRQFCMRHSLPLLIEADGSRQKSLKAWADHEPPIPHFADLVVQAVGLTGSGKPLTEEHVHRAVRFAELSGLKIGDTISPEAIIRVLTHSEGGLKNIPENARRVVMLNQADTPELQSTAHAMTSDLLSAYQAVVITSLVNERIYAVHEPVAGIVLAAGESKRFGKPKQLLDWKGQPFVRAVSKTALDAGLSPVIVVTGSNAEQVEETVGNLNVMIIRNEDWKSGQASSIKAGVRRCREEIGGTIFLLADQPQITATVLRALVEKHAEGLHPIVAPMVMDRRANPVLFDRATFDDLTTLEGDIGGRAIFHKHRVEYLPWHDERLLLDVDTPEMYQRLISDGSL
jgi:molybdenum cofactor cytidylyltransferase